MAKNPIELEGLTMTGQYLTVHFTEGRGSVKRLKQVKVPWRDFLDTEVLQHIHRAESDRLKRHWGALDEELPPW